MNANSSLHLNVGSSIAMSPSQTEIQLMGVVAAANESLMNQDLP